MEAGDRPLPQRAYSLIPGGERRRVEELNVGGGNESNRRFGVFSTWVGDYGFNKRGESDFVLWEGREKWHKANYRIGCHAYTYSSLHRSVAR